MNAPGSDISCPACCADSATLLVPAEALRERQPVYCCRACGSAYFLQRRQEPDYWTIPGQQEAYDTPGVRQAFRRLHEHTLGAVSAHAPPGRRLLDAGCGNGTFLEIARAQSWEATGLDASPAGAAAAEARSGCTVLVSPVERFEPGERRWDVVTLFDLLEHCPDPHAALQPLAEALAPGGLLVIRTPNARSAFRRIARFVDTLACARLGLRKYVYYSPHYVVFSAAGLHATCARAGLERIDIQRESTPRAFAEAKIRQAYRRHREHRLVLALLPSAYALSRLFGANKLLAFARKPREGGEGGGSLKDSAETEEVDRSVR